ncbi:MAG: hypothetical protein WC205_16955 [Opitutaceae bacterium]|jgi:hypothetical protein
MKIRINSTWLATGGKESPSDLTVNGRRIGEDIPLARALAMRVENRGNASTEVSFTVTRQHANVATAESFCLLHFGALPAEGSVTFLLGEVDEESAVILAGAVLTGVPRRHKGVSTITTYTLRGGLPTDGSPGDIEPYADMIRVFRIPIPMGVKVVEVVFATPLAAPPEIGCVVLKPSPVSANVRVESVPADSITVDGFIVHLSANAPDSNYKLSGIAVSNPANLEE